MSDSFDHFLRTFMRLVLDRTAPRGTKSHLAERAHVSQATLTKWAAGSTTPAADQWAAIEEQFFLPAGLFDRLYGSIVGEWPAGAVDSEPRRYPASERDEAEIERVSAALEVAMEATTVVLARQGEIFRTVVPRRGATP